MSAALAALAAATARSHLARTSGADSAYSPIATIAARKQRYGCQSHAVSVPSSVWPTPSGISEPIGYPVDRLVASVRSYVDGARPETL